MPGKSILKSAGQDDAEDHTGNHETADDPATPNGGGLTPDVTETFSSTTYVNVHGIFQLCLSRDSRSNLKVDPL